MFGLYESAFGILTWGNILMFFIAGVLIYLGAAKKMEPVLLIPIGFGIFAVNLPLGGLMIYSPEGFPAEVGSLSELIRAIADGKIGLLNVLYTYGIESEVIPLLIFLGVGAMTDFTPTVARPISFIFGATAQLGVFVVFLIAYLSGMFTVNEAASVGIIGGSDGPPTVYLTAALAPHLLGPITLVAYSYMALVPILQPPIIRLLTTKEERAIYMKPQVRQVSRLELVLFPIIIFIVAALLVPKSVPLIGMFMFGNLLRASGVTDRLAQSAGGVFIDVLTFLLGIIVGSLMPASVFLQWQTLAIIGLAIVAFAFSTAGGLLSAKFVNLFLKEKINPMIGAAGVSAVPMSARVVQKMGQEANPRNFLLMHAMGPNMAGAVSTSVVAGILLGMLL
ncbi:MAG: glutaconyl-CoA decarboxylase subunit beta [Dehalococcoidales bacterium]|nr:glutaconyl-CoA decarboxylase subunit beta [Dehalococcoidales bacterium]|tara:strand:- start:1830 stop:3005 length:1176 start_codon:yes stop_codon:yes gene_type:complete